MSDGTSRAVLLDIEGTIVPIDFVYNTLFPYARTNLESFLEAHQLHPEVEQVLSELASQNASEAGAPQMVVHENREFLSHAVQYLEWLMDRDSKSSPLKSLQGLIWKQGFARGELNSTVFDDVPLALQRWQRRGFKIAIYSSGSVLAQKLVLSATQVGDLTPYIGSYFDTAVGPKKSSSSYAAIAHQLQEPPSAILFVSDNLEELQAASESGMQTLLSVRPGNPPITQEHAFKAVRHFNEL